MLCGVYNGISKKYNSIVAAGMCVASYFLDELDPATNHTISVWVPASKVIINTEVDPPTAYFVARNNVTVSYLFPISTPLIQVFFCAGSHS